jgi:hypothetical protein
MKLTQEGRDSVVGRGSVVRWEGLKQCLQRLVRRDRRALGLLDLTAVPPEEFRERLGMGLGAGEEEAQAPVSQPDLTGGGAQGGRIDARLRRVAEAGYGHKPARKGIASVRFVRYNPDTIWWVTLVTICANCRLGKRAAIQPGAAAITHRQLFLT